MSIPPSGYPRTHCEPPQRTRRQWPFWSGAAALSSLGRAIVGRSAKLIAAGMLIGAVVTQAACGDDGSVCQPTADRPDCEAYFSLMPAVAITLPQRSVSALT